jgi:hypothetical protein
MELVQFIPREQMIFGIASKTKSKFPSSDGECEYMARELSKALNEKGIRANHVMGIFELDEPGAWKYRSDEDEDLDEYQVNHDWISVEGKILDISADQFRKYMNVKIPDIVYIKYSDPLFRHYKEIGYVN